MSADDQDNPFRPNVSGLEKTPSKEVSSERAAYNIITDTVFGLNARKRDNAFQAKVTFGSVVLFAIIGITVVLLNSSWKLPWFAGALVGSFAASLKRYAFGDDDRTLEFDGEVKSVSAEETFDRDTDDRRVLVPLLKEQARELAEKLAKERLAARTVQVKVRYSDFKVAG